MRKILLIFIFLVAFFILETSKAHAEFEACVYDFDPTPAKAGELKSLTFTGNDNNFQFIPGNTYYALLINESGTGKCAADPLSSNWMDQGCVTKENIARYENGKVIFNKSNESLLELADLEAGQNYTLKLCNSYSSLGGQCVPTCESNNIQIKTEDDKPPPPPPPGKKRGERCEIVFGSDEYNKCNDGNPDTHASAGCAQGLYCDNAFENACIQGTCQPALPPPTICAKRGKTCGGDIRCCYSSDYCAIENGSLPIGTCKIKPRQIPKTPCGTSLTGKEGVNTAGECTEVFSALGIPIKTNPIELIPQILKVILGFAGAIVIILIIRSGYKLMFSQGNPEKVQEAKDELTSAIVGLLFIIFSFVLLQFITNDILNLEILKKGEGIKNP